MGWLTDLGNAMLGGLPNIIGSALGAVSGIAQQNSANRANMELAQYQFDRNLEMWNKQNEYNTPANQMARYMEAGLNPNLIYSQGTPGIATNAPQYKAPEIRKFTNFGDFGMSSAMQAGLSMQQTKSNIELAQSQKEVNDANILLNAAKRDSIILQRTMDYNKYNFDKSLWPTLKETQKQSLENLKLIGDKTQNEIWNMQAQRNLMQVDAEFKFKQMDEIQSRIHVNEAQAASLYKGMEEAAQRILESDSRIKLNEENLKLVTAKIRECTVRIDREKVEFDTKRFEEWFMRQFGHKVPTNVTPFRSFTDQLQFGSGQQLGEIPPSTFNNTVGSW